VADQPSREASALAEMVELLKNVAAIRAPDRALAVRYTASRALLLESRLGPQVPGFLLQCVSVFKFHDFINLYAPDLPSRIAFIDEAFEGCVIGEDRGRGFDVFGEDR
jgi:hypothetical protein